jgi:hypothetical protein
MPRIAISAFDAMMRACGEGDPAGCFLPQCMSPLMAGTFRTCLAGLTMSVAGGKADLAITNADFRK